MFFQAKSYRSLLKSKLAEFPKHGYGQARRLATYLNCHTTLLSQVLSGQRDFSPEQAILVTEFLGMPEDEAEYFMLLVQLERAGSDLLKKNIEKKLNQLRDRSAELVNRLTKNTSLSEAQKAVFYSDWSYSAVRQCTCIKGLQDVESISKHLNLPRKHVAKVLEFLVETGLCLRKGSQYVIGPRATHLESTSPWVRTHHSNWRQKALSSLNDESPSKLHYSAPMTLSASDALVIREKIVKLLQEIDTVIEPSPSEELHCINIDWFNLKPARS